MSHGHNIYDDDKRFIIDPVTRIITTPEDNVPVLLQYDHNSEYITFEADRFVEGHDLSRSSKVEVHYINASKDTRKISKGVYEVQNLRVDDNDSSKIVFTWIVSENATLYEGILRFVIAFTCLEKGELLYRWNTKVCDILSISQSINNGEAINMAYSDVLEMWRLDLFGVGDTEENRLLQVSQEQQEKIALKGSQVAASIPDDYSNLQATVDSLTEDDYVPQTTMSDNTITETYDDGRYKVTTVSGQTITEQWYTSADVLTKTKIIVISQNGVTESITTA